MTITMSKDQVKEVISCFSPASKGELISVVPQDGYVRMLLDDGRGIVSIYELTVEGSKQGDESFYIKRETLRALTPVMADDELVSITVLPNSLEVAIGGTTLHIGRVAVEMVINGNFLPDPEKTIKLPSDVIRNMARAVSVVKGSTIALEPVFMLGEQTTLGSSVAYTSYNAEKTLSGVQLPIRSEFFDYFANIARMGDIVTIEIEKTKEGSSIGPKVKFSCGKTHYISDTVGQYPNMIKRIDDAVESAKNRVYIGRDKLISALKKLKLPYVGYSNPPKVRVLGEDGKLKLVVTDEFNQVSTAEITVPLQQTSDSIMMGIDDMVRACEVQKEDFELAWAVDPRSSKMIFKNEDQVILISAFIDKVKQGKTIAPKPAA